MTPEKIGKSVVFPVLVVVVLASLWQFMPTSGLFSEVTNTIRAVDDFVFPAMVVGVGTVGLYLLNKLHDGGW